MLLSVLLCTLALLGCLVSGLGPLKQLGSRGREESLTDPPRPCGRASYHEPGGQKVRILRIFLAELRDQQASCQQPHLLSR